MSGSDPIISIITPSFNRADELEHLYNSLSQQTVEFSLFEFIISDDGSTDNTKELIENWQKESPFHIKYITQGNQGPGAARNHGLEYADGKLILFIDSDCEAHPDWVKTIYREFQQDSFDACGGPDRAKDDFTSLQKAIDFSMTSFFTTGGMRGHSEKMMANFFPRTHNMGIKREIYENIGGFGELRHGQDIEFSNRIRNSNARIKFLIDAVVYHRRRSSIKQFFKQVFNWGVARVNLGKIDSKMLEPIHFLPSLATLLVFSIIIGTIYYQFPLLKLTLFFLMPLVLLAIFGAKNKKDLKVFLFLFLIIPAQIFGYGIGFILNYLNRNIMKRDKWTGFTKNYYKK
tara:strand:- start:1307 stop:2341 length:1035 start_codon:yes stop_codon:yes gene_type:complete